MPSFAFWKNAKADPTKAPLLAEDTATTESSMISPSVPESLDLNPEGEDSGIFLFDDDALPLQSPRPDLVSEPEPLIVSPPLTEHDVPTREPEQEVRVSVKNYSKKLISTDNEDPPVPPAKLSSSSQSKYNAATSEPCCIVREEDPASFQLAQETLSRQLKPVPSCPEQSINQESPPRQPVPPMTDAITTESCDRDSGVCVSDDDSLPLHSQPTSLAPSDINQRPRNAPVSPKHTVSTSVSSPRQRTDSIARLKRPAELNLGANPVSDSRKPRSELEKRYDLIRNSKTQSKAALRSPTALLKQRLNMPTKEWVEEDKTRVFIPPRQTTNGCWLPGPGAQVDAFTSTSVRARTGAGGRPAWWCKVDKLVVFDGVDVGSDGDVKMHTRTSKGLGMARRRGDIETIVIPMDCAHCREMLNRYEWKYDMRVCKRSVCWDCKERCKWEREREQEKLAPEEIAVKPDANRCRADSVLQDEEQEEEQIMQKVDIEQEWPMSPVEAMGGIGERLESRKVTA